MLVLLKRLPSNQEVPSLAPQWRRRWRFNHPKNASPSALLLRGAKIFAYFYRGTSMGVIGLLSLVAIKPPIT